MKRIVLIFALLSSLLSYPYGLSEELGRAGLKFGSTVEFDDDGDGPPVEDPPAPIDDWIPYAMTFGVLIGAGYYLQGRTTRKPE
ncbi:hypothetical protein HYN59_16245 [Flavobacterium album]|uniref:Uncharacterized protein n=1 Tax=Flavobacterium album TaxID=2175091 RepID=A0A2S1R1Z5_9FLAO|nr:hypothetical protein [Flavobacterium album]AWH86561.1 hypothetical protein HYN59_16245 [Flavobacterium album]